MRITSALLATAASVSITLAGAAHAAETVSATGASVTLVLTGRIIDGTGRPPIDGGVVLVAGDRIACAGTRPECPPPEGAPVFDAGTGTILPGLIDLHVHARPHYLPWFLAAGVTTVRDANNSLVDVGNNLATTPRPRVFWTGPLLDGPDTVLRFFGEDGVMRPTAENIERAWAQEVTTAVEARQAVDLVAAHGAHFVKLYEQLAPEVFHAASAHAAQRGLRVMADLGMHSTRGLSGARVDALQAIEAGITSLEHASGYALAYQRLGGDAQQRPFDTGLIEQLAVATVRGGVALVPTLSVLYAHADDVVEIAGLPMADALEGEMLAFFEDGARRRTEAGRERSLLSFELAGAMLKRVHELGGRIGAGSDAPAGVYNLPGGGLHRELELLVRAGLEPLEALHAATGAAGEILGEPALGRLAEGAPADLLVVAGNPAEDILATRSIVAVFRDGERLDIHALRSKSSSQGE